MREIKLNDLPQDIVAKIQEKNPFSEDIGIVDNKGNLVSVIINNNAYQYFLNKIEKDEEAIDQEELKNFDSKKEKNNAIDFDELTKGD